MKNSKSLFWGLINFSLVILITFGFIGIGFLIRVSNSIVPTRTIIISGEGEVVVAPDIATVNFSVFTQGADPEVIQKENTDKMNKAIAYVKALGVEDEDIKTSNYRLNPRYVYDEFIRRSKVDGYEVRQTVTIKIRDLEKAGEVISGLPAQGINEIGNLNYSIENPELMMANARQEAFNNAHDKARTMAKQAGVRLVRVVTFHENGGSSYPERMYMEKAMSSDMGMVGPILDLEPGSQDVVARVSVTYEIR